MQFVMDLHIFSHINMTPRASCNIKFTEDKELNEWMNKLGIHHETIGRSIID